MAEYMIKKEEGIFQFQHYIYIRRWWFPFWIKADYWPYDAHEDAVAGAEKHASGGIYLGKFQKT